MDLSKFSDSEFEVKDWVNGALRAHKDTQTPVDVRKQLNLSPCSKLSVSLVWMMMISLL